MLIFKFLHAFGEYLELMGRTFSRPERWRMFFRQYLKEMAFIKYIVKRCKKMA